MVVVMKKMADIGGAGGCGEMGGGGKKVVVRRGRPRRRAAVRGSSVRVKVKKLQKLVPGGRGLQEPDRLFLQTAEYILHLRQQLNILQALSKIYKL
ncbi:uncharacterized protein LOC131144333 [Malania oleifera]|uniref:uncharacterized protein LOC131144333 n=1 Tax=Malania oleifera TaxID=397392 RepID=UPI0025AE7CD5|nr:uncharacterized protein LOC131144333 [Malania oleifera]